MKIFYKILGLIVIDVTLIWLWVEDLDPDPSISIFVFISIPVVFIFNLLLAVLFYLLKKLDYAKSFLINSILASIIMGKLFGAGIDRHQRNSLESWEFTEADTTFHITRWKKESEFSFSSSTNIGSSTVFLEGRCEMKNGEFILSTASTVYKIKDDYLIGFRKPNQRIKLEKIER
ncbi:hypothetical protein [Sabulibacter ruber]|uniref:hypothetical protein n=1 Tax=Sabulibacter ruber TaxID=2811901 RepID=UPI001A96F8BB|nr:hypothetical protein [Sabulibacter ruber]